VGTASLQVARAGRAHDRGGLERREERVAREAGADEVLRSDGPWKDQAKELSGGGVDMVLDPVGGDRFYRQPALARRVRLVGVLHPFYRPAIRNL